MVMWSGRGKRLGTVPNGPAGDPARGSAAVRRGWLHQVLREEAQHQDIPIGFGKRLEGITEVPGGVRASFSDGSTADAEILIGCDGVNSVVRRFIDPTAPEPSYAGIVGLGGYARVPGLGPTPDTQHFVFGRRSFFGYLVREDGEIYWFANIARPQQARGSLRATTTAEWMDELTALHAHDPYPVPQILAAHTGELRGYPVHDLPHVPRWSRGPVVAIGDAVHAISPSAGQGASLALEDAIVLAQCLRDLPTTTEAFATYQRVRQPRAEAIVAYAQEITRRKTISRNPLVVLARDTMLPIFLRKAAADTRVNWLYDHDIAWARPADALS
jgi:2-polyprenyl-6-methoxyphenol hydroxylase-like FAD-dependent oxidoreductase